MIKSAHAALLNRLNEMQASPYYATARDTLAQAERVIVEMEAIVNAPRGTDAQILKERELTASAIEGAMAFGHLNENAPPSNDHWLATWWVRGREAAEAYRIADEAMYVQLRSHGWSVGWTEGECYRYPPSCDSAVGEEVTEAVEWLLPRGYLEQGRDEHGEFIRVLRRPGEPG